MPYGVCLNVFFRLSKRYYTGKASVRNLNTLVVQLLRQFGKIEVAPTHPLQCRGQGKNGVPDSQRTAFIKTDSSWLEARKLRLDGLDLIRGNAHGYFPPMSFAFPGQAGRLPTGFTSVKHSGLYLRLGRRFPSRHLTAFAGGAVAHARQSLRVAFPLPAAVVPLSGFALQLILLACDEMLCGQGRTQSADCLCRHFQYAPVIEKRCFREWLLLTQQTFRLLGLSLIVGNALFQFRLTLSQSADGAERIPDKQQSIPGKAIVFFLLLLVLAGIQMLSGRAGLLFHAALNGKAAALQMERELALQFFQTCRVYILLAFRRPSRVTGT